MYKLLLLVCLAFVNSIVTNVKATSREVLSFDKGWSFHLGDIPFPEVKGHTNSYRNAKAGYAGGAASPEYDDSKWCVLNLPHDWAIEGNVTPEANLSQGYYKRGFGWYRRKFKLSPNDKGKHIELQFDGISTHATIWVNGTLLHRNWCGYTSMYIDVTPYVNYGDNVNTIAVRVDADAQEGWWYEGAGIYRHVWLVKRSSLHIVTDGVFASPVKESGEKWKIPAEITLYNSGKHEEKAEVEIVLSSRDGKQIATEKVEANVKPLSEKVVNLDLFVNNPRLWSPDTPVLYNVTACVRVNGEIRDNVVTHCGFRTIRFDADTGFWLNGKNIKLKGVCNHQDHAGVGVAVPDALWEYRLRLLKDMGVNAYRSAHNPAAKEFMDACDSLGIMVMDENRLFNTSPEYVRQLEWLVRRDRSRPSVILWSVFNEEPMQGTENGYEMVRRMCDVVKKLDGTRPVTAAMNGGFFSEYNVSQAVDVGGFNYQINNYDRFHKLNPKLPLTSSEDGSAFMVRGEYVTDRSKNLMDSYDTQHANWGATHRNAWRAIAERPWMAGCFYWTGFDYHGEPTPFKWPSVSSFFGIMDLCGFPKMAYYLHQAQWLEEKDVLHLVPHWNWPSDSVGKSIRVMALSNADKVKLILNGKVISEQKVDPYEMNLWNVPYKPGKLEAVSYKNGKIVARTSVMTTGKAYKIKMTPYRKEIWGDGHDAIPVKVEVLDKKGHHIPIANNMVEFSISGDAKIIGLGNGNPNCHESEKGNKRSLFNGLAQVIIQSLDNGKGYVKLTAESEGLELDEIVIPVKEIEQKPFVPVIEKEYLIDKWSLSPLFHDRPEVNQGIAENDMNNWQQCSGNVNLQMENSNYVILRTIVEPVIMGRSNKLVLKELKGKAEVWIGGNCIGIKKEGDANNFVVDIPRQVKSGEIRILIHKHIDNMVGMSGCSLLSE